MSLNEDAYLGKDIQKVIELNNKKFCKLLLFYKYINRYVNKNTIKLNSETNSFQQIFSNVLLGRALETYQAIYILFKSHIFDSTGSLLRQLYEIMVKIMFCCKDGDFARILVFKDILDEINWYKDMIVNHEHYLLLNTNEQKRKAIKLTRERYETICNDLKNLSLPKTIIKEIFPKKESIVIQLFDENNNRLIFKVNFIKLVNRLMKEKYIYKKEHKILIDLHNMFTKLKIGNFILSVITNNVREYKKEYRRLSESVHSGSKTLEKYIYNKDFEKLEFTQFAEVSNVDKLYLLQKSIEYILLSYNHVVEIHGKNIDNIIKRKFQKAIKIVDAIYHEFEHSGELEIGTKLEQK